MFFLLQDVEVWPKMNPYLFLHSHYNQLTSVSEGGNEGVVCCFRGAEIWTLLWFLLFKRTRRQIANRTPTLRKRLQRQQADTKRRRVMLTLSSHEHQTCSAVASSSTAEQLSRALRVLLLCSKSNSKRKCVCVCVFFRIKICVSV